VNEGRHAAALGVVRGAFAGALPWKTARNAGGVVTKMFDDAASWKNRALRVREDDPPPP
jgi:hypothetical protein